MEQRIENEIKRINELKNRQMATYVEKNTFIMIAYLSSNDEEKNKIMLKKKDFDEYYENAFTFLDIKIEFFNYVKRKEFPKNFIEVMNEKLNDWLLSGWKYLGMEEHKKQADDAKTEFEFYKAMINRCGVIQYKKKPTRRGGKKHRKK